MRPSFLAINPEGRCPPRSSRGTTTHPNLFVSILEYLDERYPHPPLLPTDLRAPRGRARWSALIAERYPSR